MTTVRWTIFFSMFFLACCLMSAWTWVQFLQWLAEDVKCP